LELLWKKVESCNDHCVNVCCLFVCVCGGGGTTDKQKPKVVEEGWIL
jgi:hypothetical protein